MKIPILSGIYANVQPDFRTSYPLNLVPTPKATGINEGYLRPGDGIASFGSGPGVLRGAINWLGNVYAVMGSKLVSVAINGTVTVLGDVGTDTRPVTMDYGFDRLAITSAGKLFYYDGTLIEVTDPDLGAAEDVVWVDGYYMTTDGTFLVVTDLSNPLAVNPLKYGSAEADPDPINALLKLRNEVAALNRHTIEFFDNIGGDLFPFQRIEGAQIEKGCVGTYACCIYMEAIAFLGSGFNEQISVYLGLNGQAQKLSTHEIDLILAGYSEDILAETIVETRNEGSHQFLYIHLPDKTLVYDAGASAELQTPVWFTLTSGDGYRARFFTRAFDKWLCGDPDSSNLGYLVRDVSTHWGAEVSWEFSTQILFNEGRGAIIHELELTGLTGSVAFGVNPAITTSYSIDGVTWSQDRTISAGAQGDRAKRLVWAQCGAMQQWRLQRFRGTSDAHVAVARLEGRVEPLAW
jgi:hypothetical protein